MEVRRVPAPEELELDQKRKELSALETQLVERELELTTLQQELAAFEAEYLRVVGRRYAMLDDIVAQIEQIRATGNPTDRGAQQRARTARSTADTSATQVGGTAAVGTDDAAAFAPSASLKAVYRTLSRKVHPDLAPTDDERSRRNEWMAKVNDAYKRQREDVLNELLTDWDTSPDAVSGEGTALELVRAIRKIAQVTRRLDEIDETIEALMDAPIYDLYVQNTTQLQDGKSILQDLSASLDARISGSKRALEELERGNS